MRASVVGRNRGIKGNRDSKGNRVARIPVVSFSLQFCSQVQSSLNLRQSLLECPRRRKGVRVLYSKQRERERNKCMKSKRKWEK